jgi:hypothetical protein
MSAKTLATGIAASAGGINTPAEIRQGSAKSDGDLPN